MTAPTLGARRSIVDAAVYVFDELGYSTSGLADILRRAGVTKGAFYYHFTSKEAVALAIVENTSSELVRELLDVDPTVPALETMVRGSTVFASRMRDDVVLRTGIRLIKTFGGFHPATAPMCEQVQGVIEGLVRRALFEGDLRSDADPTDASQLIVAAILGADALVLGDMSAKPRVVADIWKTLIRMLAAPESVDYLTDHLDRTLRLISA